MRVSIMQDDEMSIRGNNESDNCVELPHLTVAGKSPFCWEETLWVMQQFHFLLQNWWKILFKEDRRAFNLSCLCETSVVVPLVQFKDAEDEEVSASSGQ